MSNSFARNRKKLSRKYPELNDEVGVVLERVANSGPAATADKIPGLDGHPVFKERLRLRNQGRRGAARIIYFCDSRRVCALFLFVKADREDVPAKEIRDALKAADLLGPDESPLRGGARHGRSDGCPPPEGSFRIRHPASTRSGDGPAHSVPACAPMRFATNQYVRLAVHAAKTAAAKPIMPMNSGPPSVRNEMGTMRSRNAS